MGHWSLWDRNTYPAWWLRMDSGPRHLWHGELDALTCNMSLFLAWLLLWVWSKESVFLGPGWIKWHGRCCHQGVHFQIDWSSCTNGGQKLYMPRETNSVEDKPAFIVARILWICGGNKRTPKDCSGRAKHRIMFALAKIELRPPLPTQRSLHANLTILINIPLLYLYLFCGSTYIGCYILLRFSRGCGGAFNRLRSSSCTRRMRPENFWFHCLPK